jgi:hypothetical protein
MVLYGAYELSMMLILLFSLGVLTAGWGQLVARVLGLPTDKVWYLDNLWLGLICITSALSIAHFFIPINWPVRCGVMLVGLYGLARTKDLYDQTALIFRQLQRHPWLLAVFSVCLTMLCLKALQAPRNFDSALYHFQTMRWLSEYSIVPGLGNLHGRLAFNQSYFNLLAFLNIQPLGSKSYSTTGVFITLLCMGSLSRLYLELCVGRVWIAASFMVGIALSFESLPSPTPDLAVALLQLQIFICLISLFNTYQTNATFNLTRYVVTIFLACFIFTVKISGLFFALATIAVVMPLARWRLQPTRMVLIKTSVLCAGMIGIHLVRGYMLSGAPLFPSTFGAIWSLPWAMLPANVQGEAAWIYSWARLPGQEPSVVLGNWNWLNSWWARLPKSFMYVLSGSLLLALLNMLLLTRSHRIGRMLVVHTLYLPLILATIFWFFTAPDYRFLGAIPVLFVAVGGWLISLHLHDLLRVKKIRFFNSIASTAFVALVSVAAIFLNFIGVRSLTLHVPEHLPSMMVPTEKINTGQIFYQPQDGLCWYSALPCTPFVYPDLKLLAPESGIAAGFTLK